MEMKNSTMGRAQFIRGAGAAVLAAASGNLAAAERPAAKPGEMRALMATLGHNMWCDWFEEGAPTGLVARRRPHKELVLNEDLWRKAMDHAAASGVNCLLLDLGEGVRYPSHPELAVPGSWSPDKMRAEVRRLKSIGIETIPKLNFSTTHNGWLGVYRRRISTPEYYSLCDDLVRDVAEIFDTPRFMHIGYDEESCENQGSCQFEFMLARRGELWWHDFLKLVGQVEKRGMRAWMWSDYGWKHPDFVTRCPKSVLQSNWYYDEYIKGFDLDLSAKGGDGRRLGLFVDLHKAGFEQVPCGSNWMSGQRKKEGKSADDVMRRLVAFCRDKIAGPNLKGFLMAPWRHITDEESFRFNVRGIDLLAESLA